MLDTMTATKIVGGFCSMLLVFLLGGWVAEALYHQDDRGYGDEHTQAYTIDTGADEGGAEEEAAPEVPFAEVFAAADAGAGERLWRQCSACHAVDEPRNGTGPHLVNVVGRPKGAVEDYSYSDTLAGMGGEWTPENISGFIANPREYAPGTKMSYNGLRDIEDRANLIAWLQSQGG